MKRACFTPHRWCPASLNQVGASLSLCLGPSLPTLFCDSLNFLVVACETSVLLLFSFVWFEETNFLMFFREIKISLEEQLQKTRQQDTEIANGLKNALQEQQQKTKKGEEVKLTIPSEPGAPSVTLHLRLFSSPPIFTR